MDIIPVSIAPMLDRTDRHYRYFMRLITKRTLLYTEMVTVSSILHGNKERLLGYDQVEHPVALQLGGDDPVTLRQCAKLAEDMGYDEVNLNVGCPSERVQNGNFGACLMAQPELVADCVKAMKDVVGIPVTVKHRIGIDHHDSYEYMANFVDIVSKAGTDKFTVHARTAWLQGLSPKENRTIPPLRYEDVHRLKREFPHLRIEINGGITSLEQTQEQLQLVDAVMIGRAAYDNPWMFASVDNRFLGGMEGMEGAIPSRIEVAEKMVVYIEEQMAKGHRMLSITRHMLQLFAGQPGARIWRRIVGEASANAKPQLDVIVDVIRQYREEQTNDLVESESH